MKFRAVLQLNGKTATGIEIPAEVLESLNAGKRPAISVTINQYTYRSTVGTVDGKPMIPVSSEVRQAAGITAGEEIEVALEVDSAPRTVEVPDDLAAALAEQPGIRAKFDALNFSTRKAHVQQVETAKAAETRTRRIASIVANLSE